MANLGDMGFQGSVLVTLFQKTAEWNLNVIVAFLACLAANTMSILAQVTMLYYLWTIEWCPKNAFQAELPVLLIFVAVYLHVINWCACLPNTFRVMMYIKSLYTSSGSAASPTESERKQLIDSQQDTNLDRFIEAHGTGTACNCIAAFILVVFDSIINAAVLVVGGLFICTSTSIDGLVLNCCAVAFILHVDLMTRALVPMEPSSRPNRWDVNLPDEIPGGRALTIVFRWVPVIPLGLTFALLMVFQSSANSPCPE